MESANALSLFRQMPENKAQIETFIRAAEFELTNGDYNPLEVEKQLKVMEELIAGIRKNNAIRSQLMSELDKYTEKTISAFGADFTKSGRTTYDYSTCNDSDLQELQTEADVINEKLKKRQEMLKNIVPQSVVNPDTGEYLQPPSKKFTEFVTIKIK
jgi:hypothetical protein